MKVQESPILYAQCASERKAVEMTRKRQRNNGELEAVDNDEVPLTLSRETETEKY